MKQTYICISCSWLQNMFTVKLYNLTSNLGYRNRNRGWRFPSDQASFKRWSARTERDNSNLILWNTETKTLGRKRHSLFPNGLLLKRPHNCSSTASLHPFFQLKAISWIKIPANKHLYTTFVIFIIQKIKPKNVVLSILFSTKKKVGKLPEPID